MAQSKRLRLREVRQALRLVGECRDLGHSAQAWLTHALREIQQLLKANVVLGAMAGPAGFSLQSQLHVALSIGWETPRLKKTAMDYLAQEAHLRDPAFQRYQQLARPNITLRPLRLISRKAFATSEYHAVRIGFGIEDMLFSQRETANRLATFSLSPQRPPRDAYFSDREAKLLRLLHSELALLAGNVLSDGLTDPLAGLSPRLRQTLTCLLAGDSEKAAALRMNISRHTAHDYVVALYKHFQVNSRGELMAYCWQRGIREPHGNNGAALRGSGEGKGGR